MTVLEESKLKAENMCLKKFVFGRIEDIVRKGENAGYQHFSPFPTMFTKGFLYRVVKSRDCNHKIV